MYIVLIILAIIASILMMFFILIQNPKGGGLSATFGGFNQLLGAKRSTDVVEKSTWYLASALLAICLFAALIKPERTAIVKDEIDVQMKEGFTAPTFDSQPIEE